MKGKIKTMHIDRKLAEMKRKHPDHAFSSKEIAMYCGASERLVKMIQKKAINKLKQESGLWEILAELK